MYHVILTASIILFSYLFTGLLSHEGFIKPSANRKFWNYLLLIAFLITAPAGIFLALQLTYRWSIPLVKEILQLHVEAGIAFSFTAILHLWKHLYYYSGGTATKSLEKPSTSKKSPYADTSALLPGNLFALGFATSALQLLILREFLNLSGGYELITGTFFAVWLLISAAGAYQAASKSHPPVSLLNFRVFTSPALTLALFIIASELFINPGQTPGYFMLFILLLVVLTPTCFYSGYAFVRLTIMANKPSGKSFATETVGGIVAGIAVAILTSGVAGTFTIWLLLALSAGLYTPFCYSVNRPVFRRGLLIAFAIISVAVIIAPADTFIRNRLIRGVTIEQSYDTKYGNIAIGSYHGQNTVFYNHNIVKYDADFEDREEGVHFAMLQHPNPSRILVISGSIATMITEIARYKPATVDFVERDPDLVSIGYDDTDDSSRYNLNVIYDDAFRFIRSSEEKYDVILMHIPPPSSLSLSRFYSTEFFADAKHILNAGGVFACSPGSSSVYDNKEAINLFASLYSTLKISFSNVIPVQGNKLWFIASDSVVSTEFTALAKIRSINTPYIGGGFLPDELTSAQTERILHDISDGGKINSLLSPVLVFYSQNLALSKHNVYSAIPLSLLILLIVFSLLRGGKKGIIMFSLAGSLAGFEMVILLLLQSTVGNLYHATGIITATVLTGLAVGSWFSKKFRYGTSLNSDAFVLILIYLLGAFTIPLMLSVNAGFITYILAAIAFIPAFITGRFYASITEKVPAYQIVPYVYGADLSGAAMGFLLSATLAIPLLGMQWSVIVVAGLAFTGYSLGTMLNK